VEQTRAELGVGQRAVLSYDHLIGQFKKNGAVLVPVFLGSKGNHENAIHIRLPAEDVTFIYLNLDVRVEDFKFWMAHELAHVYTPELAGSEEGEDFADAFAGALLFPHECAEAAYTEASIGAKSAVVAVLSSFAREHEVSLNTVFQQVKRYAKFADLPGLELADKTIHQVRNMSAAKTVSASLFAPLPVEAKSYVAAAEAQFQSKFFDALRRLVREKGASSGYIQQVLDVSLQDAMSIHRVLVN
jgi:hypothetical protein